MYYYALTIRKLGRSITTEKQANRIFSDILYWIKKLKMTRTDVDIRYHWESKRKLKGYNVHVHAMLRSDKKIVYQELKIAKPYSINFDEVRSRIAWLTYITKDKDSQQNILTTIRNGAEQAKRGRELYDSPRSNSIPLPTSLTIQELEYNEYRSFYDKLSGINLFKIVKTT